jgi:hypothetical protein
MMNMAQAAAGIAAALLVPTLVVLIAANYRERPAESSPWASWPAFLRLPAG